MHEMLKSEQKKIKRDLSQPFTSGQKVHVERTDGEIESDWQVDSIDEKGNVIVTKKEGGATLKKEYSIEQLQFLNKYKTGDSVAVERSDRSVEQDWAVRGSVLDQQGKLIGVEVMGSGSGGKLISKLIRGEEDIAKFKQLNPFVKNEIVKVERSDNTIDKDWQIEGFVRDQTGEVIVVGVVKIGSGFRPIKKKISGDDIKRLIELNS